MGAELTEFCGSGIRYGDIFFDRRCPDCACFMKFPKGATITTGWADESFKKMTPEPFCKRCNSNRKPVVTGYYGGK